eukprot:186645-Hanusia_phi.AAC.1
MGSGAYEGQECDSLCDHESSLLSADTRHSDETSPAPASAPAPAPAHLPLFPGKAEGQYEDEWARTAAKPRRGGRGGREDREGMGVVGEEQNFT